MRIPKVAVVGAGMVGGSAALLLHVVVPSCEIVIVDIEDDRAAGQAQDIAHACALWRAAHIRSGSYDDVADADVIVITAGAAMKPGETRLDLAKTNVKILKSILDGIGDKAPDATYVLATNPVDVLTYLTKEYTGLPSERVISTGTSLDSARLRSLLADRLNVVPTAIHAYVYGEHGDSAFIHWSGASVSGLPLDDFLEATGKEMSPNTRDMMKVAVRDAAHLIKQGKGVSHYGIGSSISKVVQALLHDTQLVLPVATVQTEVEGISDVCLSLPHLIGVDGAKVISYPKLNDTEHAEMYATAQVIKESQDQAKAFL